MIWSNGTTGVWWCYLVVILTRKIHAWDRRQTAEAAFVANVNLSASEKLALARLTRNAKMKTIAKTNVNLTRLILLCTFASSVPEAGLRRLMYIYIHEFVCEQCTIDATDSLLRTVACVFVVETAIEAKNLDCC